MLGLAPRGEHFRWKGAGAVRGAARRRAAPRDERPAGRPPVAADDARDDQVLPHALRAALRAACRRFSRPTAGRALATLGKILARDGRRPQRRDGAQPACRPRGSTRPIRAPPRAPFPRARSRSASCASFSLRSVVLFLAAAASLNRLTLLLSPGRPGAAPPLLVHEALHVAFAPGAGAVPRAGAGGRLDRRPRIASRRCPILLGPRRALLDGRLRRHLRAPGRGVRPRAPG